jgi:hypothetical protein
MRTQWASKRGRLSVMTDGVDWRDGVTFVARFGQRWTARVMLERWDGTVFSVGLCLGRLAFHTELHWSTR